MEASSSQPATAPATLAATGSATDPALGPNIVLLKELVNQYEPVPFEHRSHAQMAAMWGGCESCHHRSPLATTRPAATIASEPKTQANAASVPACKSCHEISAAETNIQMPNLKGAYHRQCLSCHREWMHGNACVICHKARDGQNPLAAPPPTPDDIVGRMHAPIRAQDVKTYQARFTPAVGKNVVFRHKEHTETFGLKCVQCHHRDNCSHCHDSAAVKTGQTPLHPGRTWRDSHEPCVGCHQQDRCSHCHYKDDQPAPAAFDHQTTGQTLDADHAKLACAECHAKVKVQDRPTCGDVTCHKKKLVVYPMHRPGPVLATQPATQPRAQVRVETSDGIKRVRQ